MSVSIRPARADDADSVRGLLEQLAAGASEQTIPEAFADIFQNLLSGERGRVVIAEAEGHVLGLASVSYNLATSIAQI